MTYLTVLQSQVRLFADDTAVFRSVQGQDDNAKASEGGILIYCRSGNKHETWRLIHLSVSRSCWTINTSYCMHDQLLDSVLWCKLFCRYCIRPKFQSIIYPVSANASKTLCYLKHNISTKYSATIRTSFLSFPS